MTVVALDGMGGDHAPRATVEGAVRAAGRGIEIALVGDEAVLARELELAGGGASISIVHAPDAIEMGDRSAMGMRNRRQSSIYVGMELVKRGAAEAFVSLGNTGAVLALGRAAVRRLRPMAAQASGLGVALITLLVGLAAICDGNPPRRARASTRSPDALRSPG